jgi:hypothetical protein
MLYWRETGSGQGPKPPPGYHNITFILSVLRHGIQRIQSSNDCGRPDYLGLYPQCLHVHPLAIAKAIGPTSCVTPLHRCNRRMGFPASTVFAMFRYRAIYHSSFGGVLMFKSVPPIPKEARQGAIKAFPRRVARWPKAVLVSAINPIPSVSISSKPALWGRGDYVASYAFQSCLDCPVAYLLLLLCFL